MQKAEQQVLDLHGPITPTFENYIAGPNHVLFGMFKELASNPVGWHYLSGPPSTGKTHLLLAMMHAAEFNGLDVTYLSLSSASMTPELINQLESPRLLLLDDVDAIRQSDTLQEALFHSLNRVHQKQNAVVVSGKVSVDGLGLQLPDLRSRLAMCHRYKIKALDDKSISEFIVGYLGRYKLPADDKAVDYLIKYGPRNAGLLVVFLRMLVKTVLKDKRRITIPLLSDMLSNA